MNEITELRILLNNALKEIKELKEENRKLRKRIEELEGKPKPTPFFVKPDKKTKSHKLGRPKGHPGICRPIPDHIDEEVNHRLDCCPDCGGNLGKKLEQRSRYVEDIVPKQNYKVTKHNIPRHWCSECKRIVEPKPEGVVPNFRFGLNLMLFVCF